VFDNKLTPFVNLEAGAANVFMTPTPTAVCGGAMLLCGMFFANKLRRRAADAIE
jgi:hypothetical protein